MTREQEEDRLTTYYPININLLSKISVVKIDPRTSCGKNYRFFLSGERVVRITEKRPYLETIFFSHYPGY